jgi:hypothetical protein
MTWTVMTLPSGNDLGRVELRGDAVTLRLRQRENRRRVTEVAFDRADLPELAARLGAMRDELAGMRPPTGEEQIQRWCTVAGTPMQVDRCCGYTMIRIGEVYGNEVIFDLDALHSLAHALG